MNVELMEKLWKMSQQNSKHLIYIDDGEMTNFASIMKDKRTNSYYYQFINDDESVVRNLSDVNENQVAIYKVDENWAQ